MSIEKFVALYFPLKVRSICTVKTAKWVSGVEFFILALYNSHFFITASYDEVMICVFNAVFDKKTYIDIYTTIDGVLYSWAPFTIMGVANMAIIYKFIKAKLAFKHNGTKSTSQALSNAAMRGTAILISVSMTFLVLTGPYSIVWTITRIPNCILIGVLYMGVCLNHSINALLY